MKLSIKPAVPVGCTPSKIGFAVLTATSQEIDLRREAVSLPCSNMLLLRDAGGTQLHVASGVVLLTACGHFADIELRAANRFAVPNDGLVIIEAITAVRLILESGVAAGCLSNVLPYWWTRLRAWLRQ